jgi:hypothetical protein
MKTLRECLTDYDTVLLRAIAERDGVELSTNQHGEMVEQIATVLIAPDWVTEALAWLTDAERQALDALIANGGQMRAHRFAQRFGEIRRFGPGKLAREAPWRAPVNPAEGLWYRGLLARSFAEHVSTVTEFFFIPSDLIPLLPNTQLDHLAFQVPQTDEPARVEIGDPAAIDDLCMLFALVQERTYYLQEKQLPQEAIDRLEAQFLHQDISRLHFLHHIAQSARLLRTEGRALELGRGQVREWIRKDRAQQLFTLQDTWRKDTSWNDLWHVPGIRCENTGWRSEPLPARKAILDLLKHCLTDTWLSISGFVDAVREGYPDYLRPDGDFESWYIRDARSGQYLTGFEHWDQIEGALLVYVLSGPLYWLGVLSLGYREDWEKPSAFRITPWGKAFLDLPHTPVKELPPQPARVTPEAKITLPRNAPLSDRFQLARIANWVASGTQYVYLITPASLARALSANIQVERIERFLRRISEDNLPAAAIAHIRSWAGRYGHISLQRVAILETCTPQLLHELRAHERIRGYLRQVLSPTTVLVRENDWSFLIQELYRAGYLPEIIER